MPKGQLRAALQRGRISLAQEAVESQSKHRSYRSVGGWVVWWF